MGQKILLFQLNKGLFVLHHPGFMMLQLGFKLIIADRAIFILPVSSQKIAPMPSSGWGLGPYPVLLAAGNYPQKI